MRQVIRIARGLGRVLLIAVAAVATLVGVGISLLKTDWGGERLRRIAVNQVNRQIVGRLDIGRLSFGGDHLVDRVIVRDVALRDPEGGLVAEIARAEVDVSILRLLRKEIRVTAVGIDRPRLHLVSEARGLNLSRATAPRTAKQPSGKSSLAGWTARLDRFELRDGDVTFAHGAGAPLVHIAELRSFLSARYGLGDNAFDATFGLDARSASSPAGAIAIRAAGRSPGRGAVRFDVDARAIDASLKAHGAVDPDQLATATGEVVLSVPEMRLAGNGWGPLRVEARAAQGAIEKLDLSLAIPGVKLTGAGGGTRARFVFDGKLAAADLATTARAAGALVGRELPALAGHGGIELAVSGPQTALPAGLEARATGRFERLRLEDDVIDGLAIDARAARLAADPGDADLTVRVATVVAGTTHLRGIELAARVRQRELSADLHLASPQRVSLFVRGALDKTSGRTSERGNDQAAERAIDIRELAVTYPGGRWASEGTAHLRFGGEAVALSDFRLASRGQTLAVDGAKRGDAVQAHVALDGLRLELLPSFVVGPATRVAGAVDADVKLDGTLQDPRIDVSVKGQRLKIARAAVAASGPAQSTAAPSSVLAGRTVELGQGRVRLIYRERLARAEVALASPKGGSLRVDATAPIDLSPSGRAKLEPRKVPVRGKLVARDFDVSWLAGLSDRLQTLSGKIVANLAVAGTITDPRMIGDVHWKNGRVVTVSNDAAAPRAGR